MKTRTLVTLGLIVGLGSVGPAHGSGPAPDRPFDVEIRGAGEPFLPRVVDAVPECAAGVPFIGALSDPAAPPGTMVPRAAQDVEREFDALLREATWTH